MPTEQELRDAPHQQHRVGDEVVWFDGERFCVAAGGTGDAGDAYETYEELVANLGDE